MLWLTALAICVPEHIRATERLSLLSERSKQSSERIGNSVNDTLPITANWINSLIDFAKGSVYQSYDSFCLTLHTGWENSRTCGSWARGVLLVLMMWDSPWMPCEALPALGAVRGAPGLWGTLRGSWRSSRETRILANGTPKAGERVWSGRSHCPRRDVIWEHFRTGIPASLAAASLNLKLCDRDLRHDEVK